MSSSPDLRPFSRDYVRTRLAECQGRPDLHPNTIAIYQKLLTELDASTSPEDWVRRSGPFFDVGKAEQLDRLLGRLRVYLNFDPDPDGGLRGLWTAAQALRPEQADFSAAFGRLIDAAQGIEGRIHERRDRLTELFAFLSDYLAAAAHTRAGCAANVCATFARLQAALATPAANTHWDPSAVFALIRRFAPYRALCIWDEERLLLLENACRELVGRAPSSDHERRRASDI